MTVIAFAIAAAVVAIIAGIYGLGRFGHTWTNLRPRWLPVMLFGSLLATAAYTSAYRSVVRLNHGTRFSLALIIRVVLLGFGPFVPAGGFVVDKRALHAVEGDERQATVTILGLGALEWALLAPAACICAIALLIVNDKRAMPSLLWPWALAVPIGFALALWLARPARCERLNPHGWQGGLRKGLRAVAMLPELAREFSSCWSAWAGMALYWLFDIAAFYGAVRMVDLRPNLGEIVLAYATGYALTRRSMPLGGAGITEVLMTFALHWVGEPVVPALVAVVIYRVFNFMLPAIPAFVARSKVQPLLRAAESDRPARQRAQVRAAT
jgi:uncharacterized membrane protein YbhN (UPF0104 family)